MRSEIPVMGVCSYCGCTEDNACRMPDGEACMWVNKLRTVCSSLRCVAAWGAEIARVGRDRKRVLAEMRRTIRRTEKLRRLADKSKDRKPMGRPLKAKGRAA